MHTGTENMIIARSRLLVGQGKNTMSRCEVSIIGPGFSPSCNIFVLQFSAIYKAAFHRCSEILGGVSLEEITHVKYLRS